MMDTTIITEEKGVLTIKCPGEVTLTFTGESEVKFNDLVSQGKINIVAYADTEEELRNSNK